MNGCNCQLMTREELKALMGSDKPDEREQAIGYLVSLLTSQDAEVRHRGYELFAEGLNAALFCSCLNYGSLTGGFTAPLVNIVARAVEAWAAANELDEAKPSPDHRAA
jgi:hypothetical protein